MTQKFDLATCSWVTNFDCQVCGVSCHSAHDNAPTVCPEHCEDHDYIYDRGERGHYCKHCGEPPPHDWWG